MRSLALACSCLAGILRREARAAPTPPLSHSGRWITDAAGRVVIVHGINMVYKLPPYYPAAAGFGDDDAVFLARIGFNAVRVGVIWEAVEPSPGVYDHAYLAQIAGTVKTLARHGVLALLDFHQDLLGERFQGEGAPDWAVQDGGLPNPKLGFPGNYVGNLALEHALDAFWGNAPGPGGAGLQARYGAAWANVAFHFKRTPSVLGYELFNEPWPGTAWQPCLQPTGCTGFDALLSAFNRRIDGAIRGADRRTLVWYEPNVLFNSGSATHLGPIGDRRAGFAFHDYCGSEASTANSAGCNALDDHVFSNAVAHAGASGDALMETEFGATNDVGYLQAMVTRGDRFMVPWLEWAYCGCGDPTTSGPGTKQAIVIDPSKPPGGSNLVHRTLGALVEPYPQLIAGTPRAWSFERTTGRFRLSFSIARASGRRRFRAGSVSEIATPSLVYGRRYAARVAGGAIVSASGATLLRVASCPGASTITVTVTPSGRSRGSCRAPIKAP